MSETFDITRRIEIDAAHRVPDHKSKCFNLHGHRYVVEATARGKLFTEGQQNGMVMDFGFLKSCMMAAIFDPCDHGLILWHRDKLVDTLTGGPQILSGVGGHVAYNFGGVKLMVMRDVPTAENLAYLWAFLVQQEIYSWFALHAPNVLVGDIPLVAKLRVYETPNCVAEYMPK